MGFIANAFSGLGMGVLELAKSIRAARPQPQPALAPAAPIELVEEDEPVVDALGPFCEPADDRAWQAAIIRTHQLADDEGVVASVTVWAYPATRHERAGTVARQVKLLRADLRAAAVRMHVDPDRIPMPQVEWAASADLEPIEAATVGEVETWLRKLVEKEGAPLRPAAGVAQGASPASRSAKALPPSRGDGAAADSFTDSSFGGREAETSPRDGDGEVEGEGVVARVSPQASQRWIKRWTGVLLDSGRQMRTLGERRFMDFAAVLRRGDGVVVNVWGADLARAIDAAGAKVGDRVDIRHTGSDEIEVPGRRGKPGRTTTKKLFEVIKE